MRQTALTPLNPVASHIYDDLDIQAFEDSDYEYERAAYEEEQAAYDDFIASMDMADD